MPDASERILTFERCFNFRDLGGYPGLDGRPVKWRRLFRSMTPQYMSEADAEAVTALNITLVFDLRGDHYDSSGPLPAPGGTRLALAPARSDPEIERFRSMPPQEALPRILETYGHEFARALVTMAANPAANVLFHCRLGKDRTGVFAALLLKLLGVGDDDVVQDYLLTERGEPAVRRLLETDEGPVHTGIRVADEPPDSFAIMNVLHRLVSQYGGAYGYFAHFGVTSAQLEAFVESCLGPTSNAYPGLTTSSPAPRGRP